MRRSAHWDLQQRANEYKSQTEKLNEDQKAVVATLPSLEAGIKELEGIKKTVEVSVVGAWIGSSSNQTYPRLSRRLLVAHRLKSAPTSTRRASSALPRLLNTPRQVPNYLLKLGRSI